jgi:DNA (cytosine-5)-methyltransferase 3A
MIALERANLSVERYVSYEIDKYANYVSKKNYPNIEYYEDVTTADFSQYKGFDMLIGGSPCQGFSFAGKQLNFEDKRSKLFFEYVRALKEVKPKYFLFENTPMNQKCLDIISEFLGVQPIMINSALVSAQNRKRYYWTNIPNVELPKDKEILLEDIVEPDALVDREKAHCIIASIGRTTQREYIQMNQGQIVYKAIELSNIYGGFKESKPRVHINKSVTIRAGQGGGHIPSLIVNIDDKIKNFNLSEIKKYIRKVTPLECERLQTLPDDYTTGISNTQRYKCIGNGWTVDIIAHIFSNLKGEKTMIKCKQAMESSSCGKDCCCLECEQKDVCKDVCNELSTDCEDAFTEENSLAVLKSEAAEIINTVANLTLQKKQLEEQEKEMRLQLQAAMEKYGVKSFENDKVKFVYVAPTVRSTIDSKKLKAEMPEVAEKYSKTSNVSASVKITVK